MGEATFEMGSLGSVGQGGIQVLRERSSEVLWPARGEAEMEKEMFSAA